MHLPNTRPITFLLLVIIIGVIGACTKPEPEPFRSDPIMAVGHGAIIGVDSKEITPDTTFIRRAQGYYINSLLEGDDEAADMQRSRKVVYELVKDKIYANALFIDWLIAHRKPQRVAHLTTVNNALRWHYYLKLQKRKVPQRSPRVGEGRRR